MLNCQKSYKGEYIIYCFLLSTVEYDLGFGKFVLVITLDLGFFHIPANVRFFFQAISGTSIKLLGLKFLEFSITFQKSHEIRLHSSYMLFILCEFWELFQ